MNKGRHEDRKIEKTETQSTRDPMKIRTQELTNTNLKKKNACLRHELTLLTNTDSSTDIKTNRNGQKRIFFFFF